MKSGREEQVQAMQRVKVGMTGLAAVVLLIGLAGAIFNSASKEPAVTAVGAPKPEVVANLTATPDNTIDAANQPLTDLGVAPSTTVDNAVAPTPPAAQRR